MGHHPLMNSASSHMPVVLLGAGRGGTTLLYKLLSLHRDVVYLSNYQSRFPAAPGWARLQRWSRDRHDLKLTTWFKSDGGAYFGAARRRLHALFPAPVECEPVYAECGVPLVPAPGSRPDPVSCQALADRFEAIRSHASGATLLTKRTANNRRIDWLEQAFGAPRYIHLLRDGRSVAASLLKVDWWDDTPLFWTGKTPRELVSEGQDPVGLAARNWVEELAVIEQGLAAVEASRVLTVTYEKLTSDPLGTLGQILDFMGVPVQTDPHYDRCIASLGLKSSQAVRPGTWDGGQYQTVMSIQGETLRRHGYPSS